MALISETFCLLDVGLNPFLYILFKKKTKFFLKRPTFTDLSLNGIGII